MEKISPFSTVFTITRVLSNRRDTLILWNCGNDYMIINKETVPFFGANDVIQK